MILLGQRDIGNQMGLLPGIGLRQGCVASHSPWLDDIELRIYPCPLLVGDAVAVQRTPASRRSTDNFHMSYIMKPMNDRRSQCWIDNVIALPRETKTPDRDNRTPIHC